MLVLWKKTDDLDKYNEEKYAYNILMDGGNKVLQISAVLCCLSLHPSLVDHGTTDSGVCCATGQRLDMDMLILWFWKESFWVLSHI